MSTKINSECFGDNHEHVVALLNRATALNAEEMQKINSWSIYTFTKNAYSISEVLYAAESSVNIAADIAADVNRNAALEALYDAREWAWTNEFGSWPDAFASAWSAARWAIKALVVRNLIGQYGFSQHHYDLLTHPWATVIGPVHPADKKPIVLAL